MADYSRYSKPSQARKEKLAKNLTGAPRPKRPYRKGSDRRAPKHTFIVLGENILHSKELSNKAKVIYAELSRWTGDKDGKETFAGIEKIASNLGESESTVKRGIKELQEAGFIKRTRRFGKSSLTKLFEPKNESGEKRQIAHLQNRKNAVDKGKAIRECNTDLTREVNTDLTVESGETTSNQGKQDENEAPLRQGSFIKKSLQTEPSSSSELFGSVTNEQLNDKKTNALNINELIAKLQTEALDAGVVFGAKKVDAGKLRGQVKHLRDELAGSEEVVKFYRWFFKDPRRLRRFKRAPNSFKMHKVMDELASYETAKREQQQKERDELKRKIWIESNQGEHLKQDEEDRLDEMDVNALRDVLERVKDRAMEKVGATAGAS